MDSYKRARPVENESGGDGDAAIERPNKMAKLTKIGSLIQNLFLKLGTVEKETSALKNAKLDATPTSLSKPNKVGKTTSIDSATQKQGASSATGASAAHSEAEKWRLHPTLVASIRSSGLLSFFPIQREVVPLLCSADPGEGGVGDDTVGDVCVSAPTGSGKTLVYVLPILNYILRQSSTASLAALVLLPTRELATQVAAVFSQYSSASDVRVGMLAGARSFTEEQAMIDATAAGDKRSGVCIFVATPGRLVDHMDRSASLSVCLSTIRFLAVDEADRLLAESYSGWAHRLREALTPATATASTIAGRYTSSVDDLPGGNPAVLSESDLASVSRSMTVRIQVPERAPVGHRYAEPLTIMQRGSTAAPQWLRPVSWLQTNDGSSAAGSGTALGVTLATPIPIPLRRIVCSATLTSNPQKLAALGLDKPMHFVSTADVTAKHVEASTAVVSATSGAVDGGEDARGDDGKRLYSLPASLHHAQAVVAPDNKPIALLQLLRLLEGQGVGAAHAAPVAGGLRAVVFTNSVETAHRLCRLLQLYGGLNGRVVEFNANLTSTQRSAVLAAVSAGAISVMVTSDAAARGLDLPSLPAVINYDCPSRIKTYVHRAGRTARAGRLGVCYTLISADQARHFRLMTRRITLAASVTSSADQEGDALDATAQRVAVAKETLLDSTISAYAPRLMQVLHKLKSVLEEEANGTLPKTRRLEPLGTGSQDEVAQEEGKDK